MVVKVADIRLYLTPHEGAELGKQMQEALVTAGIPYIEMMYRDKTQLPQVVAAVATWSFGRELRRAKGLAFPFVTWEEYHEDFEKPVEIAQNLAELQRLLVNGKLVQLS